MPTDQDTLELLRLYRALPPDAQRALLRCAKLLAIDPPEVRTDISVRQHLINMFELCSDHLRRVVPVRDRHTWS